MVAASGIANYHLMHRPVLMQFGWHISVYQIRIYISCDDVYRRALKFTGIIVKVWFLISELHWFASSFAIDSTWFLEPLMWFGIVAGPSTLASNPFSSTDIIKTVNPLHYPKYIWWPATNGTNYTEHWWWVFHICNYV